MLSAQRRIELMVQLGNFLSSDAEEWAIAKNKAVHANAWFTEGHIEIAVKNIVLGFLQEAPLKAWLDNYNLPTSTPVTVGMVMAGNIPLVGFHDFLCGFMSGHHIMIKLSSKDEILLTAIINKLCEWEPLIKQQVTISEMLKGCDAYIATGSNNTARYFEQYFNKYPNIIRKNRTSVAILDGTETDEELRLLADDVFSYFGLGCRSITQVCLPENYDITKLMPAFAVYNDVINHNKYKNNYDYYLAIYLLNRVNFYTNDSILMVENELPFSAVGVLHYRFYTRKENLATELSVAENIQCICGHGYLPFGSAQVPGLSDYADGVDTMLFLATLKQ
jgi:hypothetical protein